MPSGIVTICPSSRPLPRVCVRHGENGATFPYSIVHSELTHVEPAGQTTQEAPQASLSFVVLTQRPLQLPNPISHLTWHVVPKHVFAALVVALHGAHTPLQHSPPLAHAVPSVTFPVATQVAWPVLQDVNPPVWHGFDRVHATPAVQATQLPPLQTWFVPHAVPSATLPISEHMGVPVEHAISACWHGLADTQLSPAEQGTHAPSAQTLPPASHELPLELVPVGTHTISPASEHSVLPVAHTPAAQNSPDTHPVSVSCSTTSCSRTSCPSASFAIASFAMTSGPTSANVTSAAAS
jgi:hypothetical protein